MFLPPAPASEGRAHLSQVQEEAGVLARLREVGEEHRDADEQHDRVLAHLLQGLDGERAGVSVRRDAGLLLGCADPLAACRDPQCLSCVYSSSPSKSQNHFKIINLSPQRNARKERFIPAAALNHAAPCPAQEETPGTYREGVGLLPGDGCPPGRRPHLLGQRLGHGNEDEADVQQGDGRGQDHHQAVPVHPAQVRADGGADHQAGSKCGRNLEQVKVKGKTPQDAATPIYSYLSCALNTLLLREGTWIRFLTKNYVAASKVEALNLLGSVCSNNPS